MAVLMTAEVPGMTKEAYEATLTALEAQLRKAKGFIAHGAGSGEGGWRVFEAWESQEDGVAWFENYVRPNLPMGITPERTYLELHSLIRM